ncbi:MAG: zinc ribbon domain-containing protein [Pseudomonadota bacterium]
MKCPHCNEEIQGTPCPQCESTVPEGANYCMECGYGLRHHDDVTAEAGDGEEAYGFDLEDRVLCPDGTCTGIIIDGKCSECGKEPGVHEESS